MCTAVGISFLPAYCSQHLDALFAPRAQLQNLHSSASQSGVELESLHGKGHGGGGGGGGGANRHQGAAASKSMLGRGLQRLPGLCEALLICELACSTANAAMALLAQRYAAGSEAAAAKARCARTQMCCQMITALRSLR